MVEDRFRPGLADGVGDGSVEIRDYPLWRTLEGREEALPTLHVLAALGLDQTRHHVRPGRIDRDHDRPGLQASRRSFVGRINAGTDLRRVGRPVAAGHEGRRVHDEHPGPGLRMKGVEDGRPVGVEVVHREVRLTARLTGADPLESRLCGVTIVDPEDILAKAGARVAQAHSFADSKEEPRDLLMAEDEVAAGPDALVSLVDVLAVRARLA